MLYLLSLAGAVVTLSSGGAILDALLRLVLGNLASLPDFIQKIDDPLAACIPFLGIWLYYGRWLDRTMAEAPDAPRRAGMRRVYLYILSALGLGVVFIGLNLLLSFIVDLAFTYSFTGSHTTLQLTAALTMLLIGLPLWLLTWRPLQAEAFARDDSGDHARRSLTRRIYLYLALFAGVIGGMVTAVILLNTVLGAIFARQPSGLARQALNSIEVLFLFAGLGVYHGLCMRGDGRNSASALTARHAAFPVLIFDPGDGFGPAVQAAIQKAAPGLPTALQAAEAPPTSPTTPMAVVLPSDLALDLPASLRKWLDKYEGTRLVVPRAAGRWTLLGQPARLPVNQTAQAVRQLAEGQEVRSQGTPAWQIALYVVAAVIGLPILVSLIGTLVSSFLY
jgi:hypothetical protein